MIVRGSRGCLGFLFFLIKWKDLRCATLLESSEEKDNELKKNTKKSSKAPPGKNNRDDFQNLKTSLIRAQTILISTHMLPDGDGLGAETALFHYIKMTGRKCQVINPDPCPKRYRFLDQKDLILRSEETAKPWPKWDLWIIVDTNDPKRLGNLWKNFSSRAKTIIFLDHHPKILGTTEIQYPDHSSVVEDLGASSIAELLYRLFSELNLAPITPPIAQSLYVSVMTDTNSFRYAATTPLAHRIAAEMIELGVNPEKIYQTIYSSKEVSHLRLLGKILQETQVAGNGKIAWFQMGRKVRLDHKASADDTQSFLNILLLSKGAEVVCFFREEDDKRVRLSMRSKGKVAINQIAMDLGGGGHEFAAGASLPGPLSSAAKRVLDALEKLLLQPQARGQRRTLK